jgi:hypothetical protein
MDPRIREDDDSDVSAETYTPFGSSTYSHARQIAPHRCDIRVSRDDKLLNNKSLRDTSLV